MPRVIKGSWLDEYMRYTQNQESPDIFHKWCGISTVGAALERHVVVDMGAYEVRSNLFIILVSDPALCKKSTAMKLARNVLNRMDDPINIFAQKITTEALISRLGSTMKMDGKRVVHNSACMIFASELGVFLGSDAYNKGLVGVLIELYDCDDNWKYETKTQGTVVLKNTWIHLLGATTPTWLKSGFPPESAGGGFTSRMVFVYSETPRDRNPFPKIDYGCRAKLIQDLNVISSLRGKFKWSKEGRGWYEDWYKNLDVRKESRVLLGYNLRKSVNLIKIAMILSVCEKDALVLGKEHLIQSLGILDDVEVDMEMAVKAIEKSAKGSNLELLYSVIKEAVEIPRAVLIKKLSYKHSAADLDELLDTLIKADMIDVMEVEATGSGKRGSKSRLMYSIFSGMDEKGGD
ncbi:hypothetical protein LCGC14_0720590 [marine sediment metagenome]|uniref:CARD domain-containing protein n=1 Tax=marine sediment metagenome TaxID=412755 RepID=A0A0F9QGP8_9ZZZZ